MRKNAEGAADLTPLFPAVDMESRAEEIDQYSKFEEAPLSNPKGINEGIDSRIMATS